MGLPLDESRYLAWSNLSLETAMRACASLLQQTEPTTAVYRANDFIAPGALQQAKLLGVAVPETLSIISNLLARPLLKNN